MGYPNLEAEMKRQGITGKEIASYLNIGNNTVYSWLNGANASFPIAKARDVRDHFFPRQSLDDLFSEDPITADELANASNT